MLFFYVKNQLNCPISFSSKNIKLGEELLLVELFDYFHFWSTLFSEIVPNFGSAPISSDQLQWKRSQECQRLQFKFFVKSLHWMLSFCQIKVGIYYSTPCSLFGSKLHNCNHACLAYDYSRCHLPRLFFRIYFFTKILCCQVIHFCRLCGMQ